MAEPAPVFIKQPSRRLNRHWRGTTLTNEGTHSRRPAMLIRLSLALPLALLAACASTSPQWVTDADQPRLVGEGTPVTVAWGDPEQFSEIRYSQNRYESRQGDWVVQLADHIADETKRALPSGERVEVEILDIDRAGEYEWTYGATNQDVRVLRELYAPKIDLRFKRLDASGNVISEGERRLTDLNYLWGPQPMPSSDTLRFEKRLIDQWVRKEFVTRR